MQISCLFLREQADSVYLMKDWIMRRINLISPIHITNEQECIKTWPYQLFIMSCHVWSQQMHGVNVVRIRQWPTWMISWNQQAVKVLVYRNHRVQIIKYNKMWMTHTRDKCRTEVIFYSTPNMEKGVARSPVQTLSDLAGKTRCNICQQVNIIRSAEQRNCRRWESYSLRGVSM